jgi:hypothetical protein
MLADAMSLGCGGSVSSQRCVAFYTQHLGLKLLLLGKSESLRSKKKNAPARKEGIRVTSGGRAREVCVDVVPLFGALDAADRHFLVLFEEARTGRPPKLETTPAAKLQQELLATREYLQAIVEEQETTTEELRAANDPRMIELQWQDCRLFMFAVDVQERGEKIMAAAET